MTFNDGLWHVGGVLVAQLNAVMALELEIYE